MRKYFFIVFILLLLPCVFIACSGKNEYEDAIIKIGAVEYRSLVDAISNAKDGDTILVFNDVVEDINNENLSDVDSFVNNDNKTYVLYEINKPIVIKGVLQNGCIPKIHGSISIGLTDEKYKENSVTIEGLEIIHDYASKTSNVLNEKFSCGIRIIDGSANIVKNYIHMGEKIDNDIICNNDLPLFYGMVLSRPKNSKIADQSLAYNIVGNHFGSYKNYKDNIWASAFTIVEDYEDVGNFMPSKVNRSGNNYSLSIYNENNFDDNNIFSCEYNGGEMIYKSIVLANQNCLSKEKIEKGDTSLIYIGDLSYNDLTSFDVNKLFIVDGDATNVELNLKNKSAEAKVVGRLLGDSKINKYEK